MQISKWASYPTTLTPMAQTYGERVESVYELEVVDNHKCFPYTA